MAFANYPVPEILLFENGTMDRNPHHRRRKEAFNGMLWSEYLLYFHHLKW
jgi:hypothetical protein